MKTLLFSWFCFITSIEGGDVIGKIVADYQGWFATIGDGSPGWGGRPDWVHWSRDGSKPPSPNNTAGLNASPDMRSYTHKYETAYEQLGNGEPATLFSSFDNQTMEAHLSQMAQNGIDTVALQRFNPEPTGGGLLSDAVIRKMFSLAGKYGRKIYIEYDVSGWTGMQGEIKSDWLNKIKNLTKSRAYARESGKPVVQIWGFGMSGDGKNWTAEACLDVINWFKKEQGVFLIGGVSVDWRTGQTPDRPGFFPDVHASFDMLNPWMIGVVGDKSGVDRINRDVQKGDFEFCKKNNLKYLVCVLPGDLSVKRQREHGNFMWHQFYMAKKLGVDGVFISMFDEFGEGHQIAMTAENSQTIPKNSGYKELDEDGTNCSADYYLRLTRDGRKMFKGGSPLTNVRPTKPWIGRMGSEWAANIILEWEIVNMQRRENEPLRAPYSS